MSESDLLEVPFGCHQIWADAVANASKSWTNIEDPSASVPNAGKLPCGAAETANDENDLSVSKVTNDLLPCRPTPRQRQRPQLPRRVLTNLDINAHRPTTVRDGDQQAALPTSLQQSDGSPSSPLRSRLCENAVSPTGRAEPSPIPLCRSNFHPLIYPPRPRPLATATSDHARAQQNPDPAQNGHTGDHQSSPPPAHINTSGSPAHDVMAGPISTSELWDLTNAKYSINDTTAPEVRISPSPVIQHRAVHQLDSEAPIPLSPRESAASTETIPLDTLDTSGVSGEVQIFERYVNHVPIIVLYRLLTITNSNRRVCFTRNFESFHALDRKQSLLKVSRSNWDKPPTLRFHLTTVEEDVKERVNFEGNY